MKKMSKPMGKGGPPPPPPPALSSANVAPPASSAPPALPPPPPRAKLKAAQEEKIAKKSEVSKSLHGLLFDAGDLMAQKRKLKAAPRQKNFDPVTINRRELLGDIQRVDFDYLPLNEIKTVISRTTMSSDLISLSFSTMEITSDFIFYMLKQARLTFPNLNRLSLTGCIHLTDQGIKWATEIFPKLTGVELDGCVQLTEKSLYYLVKGCPRLSSALYIGTNLARIPKETASSKMSILVVNNCPLISATEGFGGEGILKMRGQKGDKQAADFTFDAQPSYKAVLVTEETLGFSVGKLMTGDGGKESVTGLRHWPRWQPTPTAPAFSLMEVPAHSALCDAVISPASLVLVPVELEDQGQETLERVAALVALIMGKHKDVLVMLLTLHGKGVEDVAAKAEEYTKKVGVCLGNISGAIYGEIHYLLGRGWHTEYVDLFAQKTYSHGARFVDSYDEMFLGVALNREAPDKEELSKIMERGLELLKEEFPWVIVPYDEACLDALKSFPSLACSTKEQVYHSMDDETRRNFHPKNAFQHLTNLLLLMERTGNCLFFEHLKGSPVVTDVAAFAKGLEELSATPPDTMEVDFLGGVVPVWRASSLLARLQASASSQQTAELLVATLTGLGYLLPVNGLTDSPDTEVCYVLADQLPAQPPMPLTNLWPDDRPEQTVQGDRYYNFFPGLPPSLFPRFLRECMQLMNPVMLWRSGAVFRCGAVDVLAEILHNEQTGVPVCVMSARLCTLALCLEQTGGEWRRRLHLMWSALTVFATALEAVCLQYQICPHIAIPCRICVPTQNRHLALKKDACDFTSIFVLKNVIKPLCRRSPAPAPSMNSEAIKPEPMKHEDLLGPPILTIVPYHNYAYPHLCHKLKEGEDAVNIVKAWRCQFCQRKSDLPCRNCGLCRQCIQHLARLESTVKPGTVSTLDGAFKDYGRGKDDDNEGEQIHQSDEDEEGDKKARITLQGSLLAGKKGTEMQHQIPMTAEYFNKLSIMPFRGTKSCNFFLWVTRDSPPEEGKTLQKVRQKLEYNSWAGAVVGSNGEAKTSDEWKAKEGYTITLEIRRTQTAGKVALVVLLMGLVIHSEEMDDGQFMVFIRLEGPAQMLLRSPCFRPNWRSQKALRFHLGQKLEMVVKWGEVGYPKELAQATVTATNKENQITVETCQGQSRLMPVTNPSLRPWGYAEAHKLTLHTYDTETAPNSLAPVWLFSKMQLHDFQGNSALNQTSPMPCTEDIMPSVVTSQISRMVEGVGRVVFQIGGQDFSGSSIVLLPENLQSSDLLMPSPLRLQSPLLCHPLCAIRGDLPAMMTLRPSSPMRPYTKNCWQLHMVDGDGFPLPADTELSRDHLQLLWAWAAYLAYADEFLLIQYKRLLKDADKLGLSREQVQKGVHRFVEMLCFQLFLSLQEDYTLDLFEQSVQTSTAAEFFRTLYRENTGQSELVVVPSPLGLEDIILCPSHCAAWQVGRDLTSVAPDMFGPYLPFVHSIHLQSNKLTSISGEVFKQLVEVRELELSDNGLTSLPPEISFCKKLLGLSINQNQLTTLPDELSACQELHRLHISENPMVDVPSCLFKLTKLQRLYMQNMQLRQLPEEIGEMQALRKLYLSGNCLDRLPASISKLALLEDLALNGVPWCKLRSNQVMSKEHFEKVLKQNSLSQWLERHDQDKAAIFGLFDEDANGVLDHKETGKLNATIFHIFPRFGYKGVEAPDEDTPSGFPTEIFSLKKLEYLSLQYQGIVSVPDEIRNLSNLKTLNLSHNPNLISISAQAGTLPLQRLELEDCASLKTPPQEIRARGFQSVYAYLKKLVSGSVECKRTKLMMVGLGGAGKTSLVKALMSDSHHTELTVGEEITDGIDICNWTVPSEEGPVTYSVWDFAGQTVYYNTHQFFLTDRAVYLLLWNIRLGHEHAGLDFWLSSISVHAPKAPIFVVGTHADQVAKSELPIREIQARYPQVAGFHFISSHTGQGVKELKDDLLETTLKQAYMGEKIPGVWLEFERHLKGINQSVVPYTDVESKAAGSGIFDKSEVSQAVQFLHELGAIQHFGNEFLRDRVVINPQWIVDVMACVVSVKDSFIKEGRLRHEDVGRVWRDYPNTLHDWMLRLTEEYDLTFALKEEKVNLVPCLLPEEQPEFKWPEIQKNSGIRETKMIYKFDYLPAGLFNRAQVRLHQFSDSALIWKRGSFLKKNEHICLIHQKRDSELVVTAQGLRPENLLFLVHEVMESLITESFRGVTYDFLIPCPDCLKQSLRDPHMFAASIIRRASELRAPFLQCLKYFHTVALVELQAMMPPDSSSDFDLHLVQAIHGLRELQQMLETDIFVSYCKVDGDQNDPKKVHTRQVVADLQKDGYKCWYKERGAKYTTDEMARALSDSRVFLAFISNDYVEDEDCVNLFKYAKLILRKPIILVVIGTGMQWRESSKLGILVADEVFVNMQQLERYKGKFEELQKALSDRIERKEREGHAPCFISYCWKNSHQAVKLGTRHEEGALGYGDPRDIKTFLEGHGIQCWIDIEKVGQHGLFEDISEGLQNAKVVIACMSDEYAASSNCQLEFRYAFSTLKLYTVLAAVGTGQKWRSSPVGYLSVNCPVVSLQEKSENAMERILELVRARVTQDDLHRLEKSKEDKNKTNEEQRNLSFQELLELIQRKFLRQIMLYADMQDLGPYPRLLLVDFLKEPENSDDSEKKDADKESTSFYSHQYGIHLLCEYEEGWHACAPPLPLPPDFGQTSLTRYAPYLARITAIIKHNQQQPLNCQASGQGLDFLKWLEESPQVAEMSDFMHLYHSLRKEVMEADTAGSMGKLARCHLPNGKTVWLCERHRQQMRVTVMRNDEVATTGHGGSKDSGENYLLQALREMDFDRVNLQLVTVALRSERPKTARKKEEGKAETQPASPAKSATAKKASPSPASTQRPVPAPRSTATPAADSSTAQTGGQGQGGSQGAVPAERRASTASISKQSTPTPQQSTSTPQQSTSTPPNKPPMSRSSSRRSMTTRSSQEPRKSKACSVM